MALNVLDYGTLQYVTLKTYNVPNVHRGGIIAPDILKGGKSVCVTINFEKIKPY